MKTTAEHYIQTGESYKLLPLIAILPHIEHFMIYCFQELGDNPENLFTIRHMEVCKGRQTYFPSRLEPTPGDLKI